MSTKQVKLTAGTCLLVIIFSFFVYCIPNNYLTKDSSYQTNIKDGRSDHMFAIEDSLPISRSSKSIAFSVNCRAILKNDSGELLTAELIQYLYDTKKPDLTYLDEDLYEISGNCKQFLSSYKYILNPINNEEKEFPIAYSILMYKDVHQVERFLRAICRPQNVYCIHVDKKSSTIIQKTMQNIASCFDNVFLTSTQIEVNWGTFQIAKADQICLKDLLSYPVHWKYFINTCGQMYPIKTNLEIVKVLKAFNGANDIMGFQSAEVFEHIKYGYKNESSDAGMPVEIGDGIKWGNKTEHTDEGIYLKPPFKYNITWSKSATNAIISRGFAEFLINSQFGREFIGYINDTFIPDEHLWSPIHFTPSLGAPGSYKGYPDTTSMSVARYTNWLSPWSNEKKYPVCRGKYEREICIISVGDLHDIVNSKKLFVNKFHADYQPLAYDCLEEYIWNNTRLDIQGVNRINISFYENLDFVKNHV